MPIRSGFSMMTTGRIRRICAPSAWWIWTYPSRRTHLVYGAFDHTKLVTRMLPGYSPSELRLMLPDSRMGTDRFHDALIDNLAASPSWRSGHISPADVTASRRRWPKAVFKTMRRRAQEDRALCHNAPGVLPRL